MNPFESVPQAKASPIVSVSVPEWNKSFFFRKLSPLEWMEVCKRESSLEFPEGVVKIAATAVCEDGHRIEGAELTTAMQFLANAEPLGAVKRLSAKVAELNGEGPEAAEIREKNSQPEPSGVPSSTSVLDSGVSILNGSSEKST